MAAQESAYAELADEALLTLATQLSTDQARRVRIIAGAVLLAAIPAVGLIFFSRDMNVPAFVPMVIVPVVSVALAPMYLRFWRLESSRIEATLELTRRGLDLPGRGRLPMTMQRVEPAQVIQMQRTALPLAITAGCFMGIVVGAAALVGHAIPESTAFFVFMYAMILAILVCLVWVMVIVFASKRENASAAAHDMQRPAEQRHPADNTPPAR